MGITVFYSWQCDLTATTTRRFIERAIIDAVNSPRLIGHNITISQDMQGIAGSPEIASTILSIILESQIFIGDVSLSYFAIPGPDSKFSPNPNVLIELAYALGVLGEKRIITVMNTAYGKPEDLPFDLRSRLAIPYKYSEDDGKDKADEVYKELVSKLIDSLASIVDGIGDGVSGIARHSISSAIESIKKQMPDRDALTIKAFKDKTIELHALSPDLTRPGDPVDLVLEALDRAGKPFVELIDLAEVLSEMDSIEASRAYFRGFENLLYYYNRPSGSTGYFNGDSLAFFQFLGHELFVSFVAAMIRNERWNLLGSVLDDKIMMAYNRRGVPCNVSYVELSEHIELFQRKVDRGQAHLFRADILKKRHTAGELKKISFEEFVAADFYLYLKQELLVEQQDSSFAWRPWSVWRIGSSVPQYLVRAQNPEYCNKMIRPLGLTSGDEFKKRFLGVVPRMTKYFNNWIAHNTFFDDMEYSLEWMFKQCS